MRKQNKLKRLKQFLLRVARKFTSPIVIALGVVASDIIKNLIASVVYDDKDAKAFLNQWGFLLGFGFICALAAGLAFLDTWRKRDLDDEDLTTEPAAVLRQRLKDRVLEYAQAIFDGGLYTKARYQFQLVERPLGVVTQDHRLDVRIDEYYRSVEGPIVVVGEAGTGKTTLLYELATVLGSDEEPSPIAVTFHLARWRPTEERLEEWMMLELRRDYGVKLDIGKSWMDREIIVPLLDGLDEVPAGIRRECLEQINDYRQRHPGVNFVLSCRESEYNELGQAIEGSSVVATRVLDRGQLEEFLGKNADKFVGLRRALAEEPNLWDLLDSPLMLWVAAFAFKSSGRGVQSGVTTREKLFERYLDEMLKRDRNRSDETKVPMMYPEEAKTWLRRLAAALQRAGLSNFHVEDLSLKWAEDSKCEKSYFWLSAWIGAVCGGLFVIPAFLWEALQLWIPLTFDAVSDKSSFRLWSEVLEYVDWGILVVWTPIAGICVCLLLEVLAYFSGVRSSAMQAENTKVGSNNSMNEDEPEERVNLWWISIQTALVFAFSWAFILFLRWLEGKSKMWELPTLGRRIAWDPIGFGATGALFCWVIAQFSRAVDEFSWNLRTGLAAGLAGMALGLGTTMHMAWNYRIAGALTWGLASALISGIRVQPIHSRSNIKGGVMLSVLYFVRSLGATTAIVALIGFAANNAALAYQLPTMAALGIVVSFLYGGAFCTRHYGTRILLRQQKVIPPRMEEFFDFAVDHVFLIRQGGSFRFIHRMFQEHLAACEGRSAAHIKSARVRVPISSE